MFEVSVSEEFSAAHRLDGYPGDCARPHGHNWKVEVMARSRELDSLQIAVDFRKLKHALREIISCWDHQDLNQLPEFQERNPTAEQVAKTVYEKLAAVFQERSFWLHRVVVWENARCSAAYFEEGV